MANPSDESRSGIIPRWNGRQETLDVFEEKVQFWMLGTKKEERVLLGPRLLSVMDEHTQQYEEAKKISLEDMCKEDGPMRIVKQLRGVRGPTSIQEAVKRFRLLMKGYHRQKSEGMRAWTSCFEISVMKVGKALHSAVPDIDETGYLHEVLRGIMLLDGTNLDPSEEAAILATTSPANSYRQADLVKALCEQWSDEQIRQRDALKFDRAAPRRERHERQGREPAYGADTDQAEGSYCDEGYQGYYEDDSEGFYGEEVQPDDEDSIEPGFAEYNMEDQADQADELAAGLEEEDPELAAAAGAFGSAARSFAEARSLLNEVKEARGYYPVAGIAAAPAFKGPGGKISGSSKGKSSTPFGKGRGRGSGKGAGPNPRPAASARPAPAGKKGGKGKDRPPVCLLCGRPGHRAENCPNRGQEGTEANKKRAFGSFAGMLADEAPPPPAPWTPHDPAATNEDDSEYIGFQLSDCEGYGILDGGASASVGGINQVQNVVDQSGYFDLQSRAKGFTFAGGEHADAKVQVELPTTVSEMPAKVYVVDKPSPILLGLDFLRTYKIVVDYDTNTAYSKVLNSEVPVVTLASSHLALPLGPAGFAATGTTE